MANTPHPTPPPAKPAAQTQTQTQSAPVKLPPVETVADEQRKRSEEIEKMGVEQWKAAHDNRPADERPRAVEGVTVTVTKHA
jgi:hypothetical protein